MTKHLLREVVQADGSKQISIIDENLNKQQEILIGSNGEVSSITMFGENGKPSEVFTFHNGHMHQLIRYKEDYQDKDTKEDAKVWDQYEDIEAHSHWDNGTTRSASVYDRCRDLKEMVSYRQDGSLSRIETLLSDGNTEIKCFRENETLFHTTIVDDQKNLIKRTYYDEDGKTVLLTREGTKSEEQSESQEKKASAPAIKQSQKSSGR